MGSLFKGGRVGYKTPPLKLLTKFGAKIWIYNDKNFDFNVLYYTKWYFVLLRNGITFNI